MTYLIFTKALEPAFSINCGATAVPGGGDCLTIAMISYIACGKNTWNIRHRVFNGNDISNLIHIKNVLEQVGIRPMSNGQEETLYRQNTFLVRLHIVKTQTSNFIFTQHFG